MATSKRKIRRESVRKKIVNFLTARGWDYDEKGETLYFGYEWADTTRDTTIYFCEYEIRIERRSMNCDSDCEISYDEEIQVKKSGGGYVQIGEYRIYAIDGSVRTATRLIHTIKRYIKVWSEDCPHKVVKAVRENERDYLKRRDVKWTEMHIWVADTDNKEEEE